MQRQIDCLDVTLTTQEGLDRSLDRPVDQIIDVDGSDPSVIPLVDVVASGRLFIMDGNGKLEKVIIATYWKDDALFNVCASGYEWNEDGETTRVWHA